MKKYWVISIIGIIILTSCEQSADPTIKPIIGVILHSQYDTYIIDRVQKSLIDRADIKATLNIVESNDDVDIQNTLIDTFILEKIDALAINFVDGSDISSIILKAKNNNIPIVFFKGNFIEKDLLSAWGKAYYLDTRQGEIGTKQGEIIVEYWNNNLTIMDRNNDGILQYIMLKGSPGTDTQERTQNSIKAIENAEINVECLSDIEANFDRTEAYNKIKEYCNTVEGKKVEAILCNNDAMALGSIEALSELPYFSDIYIPIVGVDAINEAIEAIEDGLMLGTILQDAEKEGEVLFDICYTLAMKKNITEAGLEITDNK